MQLYSKTVERYGEKRLPENHAFEDSGITYDDLDLAYKDIAGDPLLRLTID